MNKNNKKGQTGTGIGRDRDDEMLIFDEETQGGKRTYTAHNQHDPSKAKGIDGQDGTNLTEIGAKMNKNNKNGQSGLINIDIDNNMMISDDEEDEEDAEDQKMT